MKEDINTNIRWEPLVAGEPAIKRRKYLNYDARVKCLAEKFNDETDYVEFLRDQFCDQFSCDLFLHSAINFQRLIFLRSILHDQFSYYRGGTCPLEVKLGLFVI